MLRLRASVAASVLVTFAVLVPIGCGGSSDDPSEGGTLHGTYSVFPDYLDPALASTSEALTAMQNVYVPLLTYAHADGAAGTRLIPGLAEALPRISGGGKTYTLKLRPGLEYSDGRPVKASDFKFAVERLLRLNSVGSPFYTQIVGAERFARTKKGGIPGIGVDDGTGRITIRLVAPRGTFSYELGLLYAAPLPADTPLEDQTEHPPPATGPYEIADVRAGRSWALRRNPVWASTNSEAMPQLPDGHVDRFELQVVTNPGAQVDEIERGSADWMKNPPPPGRWADVERKYEGSQFEADPTISNYYFWMNTKTPPFDDVRVRRAVNYAIDPLALERIYAGTLEPLQQVLPPQMPGHRKYSPYPHDLGRAKKLIAEADPSDRDITVWTNNLAPNDEAGQYYEQVLKQLGFQTKLKAVDGTVYFTLIGNASTPDLDTGWGNWLLDYPHPNDYFQPMLSGESIASVGSTNWARFDDPAVDARIRRLGEEPLGPSQVDEYAALDRSVMEQAPWAPFGTLTLGTFVSSSIDLDELVVSPVFGQDLTSFQFK